MGGHRHEDDPNLLRPASIDELFEILLLLKKKNHDLYFEQENFAKLANLGKGSKLGCAFQPTWGRVRIDEGRKPHVDYLPSPPEDRGERSVLTGMDFPPSQPSQKQPTDRPYTEASNMATLAMRTPENLYPASRHMMRDERDTMRIPSRPRPQGERIELPSIRQAVPEIDLRASREEAPRYGNEPQTYPPASYPETMEPRADYNASFALKRRRGSSPEPHRGVDSRDALLPRSGYPSPPRHVSRPPSVADSPRDRACELWGTAGRGSPYPPPPPVPDPNLRNDYRPTLPSLPSLGPERAGPSQMPLPQSRWPEYSSDIGRSGAHTYPPSGPTYGPPGGVPPYGQAGASYVYHGPQRQSYPGEHGHLDRSPFSPSPYYATAHDPYARGMMPGHPEGGKQRKRRGNLPKETTDILRAWFVQHVMHPYPTEDEKQELMRQTGLQMNQISNWFINARRRQLPTLINNAQAESDAMSARTTDTIATSGDGDSRGVESGSEGAYEEEA